ncbi:MAG: ASKHA domain-containing protein [Planctomycetota bacterium]
MREKEIPVVFQPAGRKVFVLPGTPLVEAAAAAGAALEMPCGGGGVCGKCRLQVVAGAAPPTPNEERVFTPAELAAGWRLVCQVHVAEPVTAVVPETSRTGRIHQILASTDVSTAAPRVVDPPVLKKYVELAPPRRGDDQPDLVRLARALNVEAAALEMDLSLARAIGDTLRSYGYRGTAVCAGNRLLAFEPGDTSAEAFAVAVDIGTTTLVASLLDLNSGAEVGIAARMNPQTQFGDDVLARIALAVSDADGLGQLQQAVLEAVSGMVDELCRHAGTSPSRIYEATFSGNTTMQHLVCGITPTGLATVPFVSVAGPGMAVSAAELGLLIHPRARAYVLPVIGGFVGGDTVAGIASTPLMDTPGPSLLVDIGTNGEIVLWARGRLLAASTAAGPAFEGARISQGMRGSSGAIEKVSFEDGRLRTNVIGNVPPVGICGSGLIDAAAELLRHGLLAPQGRLLPPEQLPEGTPADLRRRILDGQQPAVMLAAADETSVGAPILLTQRDLRELQLASGAIQAGIRLLLTELEVHAGELEAVYLAGGFGNFIRRKNAQRIGLLPPEVERSRIRYQGNTSLAGARLAALSCAARTCMEHIARQAEHVDLSTLPGFQDAFADAMLFPEEE